MMQGRRFCWCIYVLAAAVFSTATVGGAAGADPNGYGGYAPGQERIMLDPAAANVGYYSLPDATLEAVPVEGAPTPEDAASVPAATPNTVEAALAAVRGKRKLQQNALYACMLLAGLYVLAKVASWGKGDKSPRPEGQQPKAEAGEKVTEKEETAKPIGPEEKPEKEAKEEKDKEKEAKPPKDANRRSTLFFKKTDKSESSTGEEKDKK